MSLVVEIDAGEFEIGDEFIPNASPRHRRRLSQSIWIDAQPVTWAHFEVFVAAGGYRRSQLWTDDVGIRLPCDEVPSIDARCRAVLQDTAGARRMFSGQNGSVREQPLTGITWFEARAIAHFFGARLPFEVEWEVAMHRSAGARPKAVRTTSVPGQCRSLVGVLQEWVGDAFSSKYWRSDFDRVGVPWSAMSPETPVVVRGASAEDMVQHISCRRGEEPTKGHGFRSFRRVWQQRPSEDLVVARWLSFDSKSEVARA